MYCPFVSTSQTFFLSLPLVFLWWPLYLFCLHIFIEYLFFKKQYKLIIGITFFLFLDTVHFFQPKYTKTKIFFHDYSDNKTAYNCIKKAMEDKKNPIGIFPETFYTLSCDNDLIVLKELVEIYKKPLLTGVLVLQNITISSQSSQKTYSNDLLLLLPDKKVYKRSKKNHIPFFETPCLFSHNNNTKQPNIFICSELLLTDFQQTLAHYIICLASLQWTGSFFTKHYKKIAISYITLIEKAHPNTTFYFCIGL